MITQIRGIIHYELLQLWRERTWALISIVITAMMFLITSSISESQVWKQYHTAFDSTLPESRVALASQMETASLGAMLMIGLVLMIFCLLLFPVLFSDVIAKDRRYNVRELWRSLPLGEGRYLVGKTIAAMLIVGLSLLLCCTVIWIVWARLVFPVPILTYIAALVLPILSVAIPNTGIILLLTAMQPTRRRAILLAVILAFGTLIFLTIGIQGKVAPQDYLNVGRPLMMRFFYTNFYDFSSNASGVNLAEKYPIFEHVAPVQVLIAGLVGFVEVGVVWVLMRSLKVWQEQR